MSGALALALHDVEPRTFSRCRAIREWLSRRGVERITLLVIPAPDLHPIGARSPALTSWLRGRVANGDAIAQHGLAHQSSAAPPLPRRLLAHWQGGAAAEFPGLDRDEAAQRVLTGRRLLHAVELEPRGFVAPGYAYTRALREVLSESFEWFAELGAVRRPRGVDVRSPALCLGTSTPFKRAVSPRLIRAAGRVSGAVMRIDIHPGDFDLPGHVATLETLLRRASARRVITYDELLT